MAIIVPELCVGDKATTIVADANTGKIYIMGEGKSMTICSHIGNALLVGETGSVFIINKSGNFSLTDKHENSDRSVGGLICEKRKSMNNGTTDVNDNNDNNNNNNNNNNSTDIQSFVVKQRIGGGNYMLLIDTQGYVFLAILSTDGILTESSISSAGFLGKCYDMTMVSKSPIFSLTFTKSLLIGENGKICLIGEDGIIMFICDTVHSLRVSESWTIFPTTITNTITNTITKK